MYNIASSIKNHRLYPEFVKVKERLREHQFVCWVAGGAVRDFILGREVSEFDLVTDATPENIKIIFPEAVLVGESFGVFKIPTWEAENFFDLAGFREEADYRDGRRPSLVKSSTPTQDAKRRDFTINAIYWDDENLKVVDYTSGLSDLAARKLRCVGDADIRFAEDHLRILRLLRFSAVLNFEIEAETLQSAVDQRKTIQNVSGERIWSEIKKINQAGAWAIALEQPLFNFILQELLGTECTSDFKLPNTGRLSAQVVFYLFNPEQDLSSVLKQRLKLSNQELQAYTQTRFLIRNSQQINVKNLTFELEKSPALLRQFNHLVSLGLIDKNLDYEAQKLMREHPENLISAAELSKIIPVEKISDEMRFIRLSQYANIIRTRGDVLDYLGKKYAIKSEKP